MSDKLKEYRLSDLYQMSSGISSTPEQAGHGYPFVSFSTIFNNYILPETLPDLMDTTEKQRAESSVKEGDILITRTSETIDELAMSSVAVQDYPNATFSGFAKRLRPKQKNITYHKFMAFFMRSKYFRKIVDCKAVMTLRASFNEEIMSYINILLPEYGEQVKIGEFCYLIEKKITLNNKINAELEQTAKTLYDYWFTQSDFPDTNGKPYKSSGGSMVYNETLHREIPLGWEVKTVKDCIEHINTGLNPRDHFKLNDGNIKYITVKNLTTDGSLVFDGCDTISQATKVLIHKRSMVEKGDILFASIAPLGRCYMVRETPETWEINESVFSIRPNKLVSSEYLYMYFMSKRFIQKAEHSSTGSVFSGIRISVLEDMGLIVPPKSIMDNFTNQICGLYEMKYKKSEENQELSALRDWLLPMLMNGQATIE